MILRVVLNKQKPFPLRGIRALLFPSLSTASCCRSENNKALLLSQQGFSFVAKRGEMSNLVKKEVAKIVKLMQHLDTDK
jgi:hypothetical protein